MAKIFPFKALRYLLPDSRLKQVVCPPYDVINKRLESKLRKDPDNAIQIELPVGSQNEKYKNAKRVWQTWLKRRLIQADSEKAFFIYEQTFALQHPSTHLVGEKKFSRKGFFCEVQVEKPGGRSILRHELTLPKPKQDRFYLLKSLEVNTSPIFGLFQDRQNSIAKILDHCSRQSPLNEFEDLEGVLHRLWKCSEPKAIRTIQNEIRKTALVIADGHHRYETAWNYCQYRKKQKGKSVKSDHASAVLFYLCPIESPGIIILPTHRVLRSNKNNAVKSLDEIVSRLKLMISIFGTTSLNRRDFFQCSGDHFKSLVVTDGKRFIKIKVKSFQNLKKWFPGSSEDLLRLPLFQLHNILLPELKKEDFIYCHAQNEAMDMAAQNHTLAFLVPPVSVGQLYSIVKKGKLMPQKSTYFYPKVITGLIFRSLNPEGI